MAQKLLYRFIGAHTRVYEYLLVVDVICTRQVSWAPDWLMLLLWLSAESGPSSEGANFGKNVLVLKDRILGNTEYQKNWELRDRESVPVF